MEIGKAVDQRGKALSHFFRRHHDDLIRQGAVVPTWRKRQVRKLGPYFLLVCRDHEGRQRSCYLGAEGETVAMARAELARLQRPLRLRRQVAEVRRQLRRELSAAKSILDQELTPFGLARKGLEIRGWSRSKLIVFGEVPVEIERT